MSEFLSGMDAQGRVGGVSLVDLVAEFGSPLYVYDGDAIRAQFRAYLAHGLPRELQLHFAMKANSNLAILRLLAAEGAGFDIVSGGELARVLQAGGDAAQVVFSGVAKSDAEMQAALAAGWSASAVILARRFVRWRRFCRRRIRCWRLPMRWSRKVSRLGM